MLTLEDLHAQINEALELNSIESSFTSEYFTDLINEQRSLWLRNEYNKNRSIDSYIVQDLPCLELELVNPIDCCFDVPGCKILRTKKKIPNTIEFHYTKGIISIGPADITKARFILIDYARVSFVGHGRTTKNAIYAFLYNNYIYIVSKNPSTLLLKYITIRGIFEDPTSLGEFVNCEQSGSCWKPSDFYPMNQWMWAYIKPYILDQLMRKKAMMPDEAIDANDTKRVPNG
jgi:hypothetical protein